MSPRVMKRAGDLIDKLRVSAAEVNWCGPQQMHLTLQFLGDVPDTETPDICRVLNEWRLSLSHLRSFAAGRARS